MEGDFFLPRVTPSPDDHGALCRSPVREKDIFGFVSFPTVTPWSALRALELGADLAARVRLNSVDFWRSDQDSVGVRPRVGRTMMLTMLTQAAKDPSQTL